MLKKYSLNSNKENCSIFYLKVIKRAILIRKTVIEEIQFQFKSDLQIFLF